MSSNDDFDWNGNAIHLAEETSAELDEITRKHAGEAAVLVVEGLRHICDGNDDIAVKVALTVTRLMAVLLNTDFQFTAETVDNSMTAYAMAAGALAGGYELPRCERCLHGDEASDEVPGFVPDEWKKYLG